MPPAGAQVSHKEFRDALGATVEREVMQTLWSKRQSPGKRQTRACVAAHGAGGVLSK